MDNLYELSVTRYQEDELAPDSPQKFANLSRSIVAHVVAEIWVSVMSSELITLQLQSIQQGDLELARMLLGTVCINYFPVSRYYAQFKVKILMAPDRVLPLNRTEFCSR